MCRLMLFNKQWLNLISLKELADLFTTLDQRNGGHGCGITLSYEKNLPVTHKGINVAPDDLADLVYNEKDSPDLKYIVYHTRLASSGEISDEMCHPFSEQSMFGLTLAHNGVLHSLSGSPVYSDTKILYDLLTVYKMPISILSEYNGVFVGIVNKKPYVIKSTEYSELDMCYTPNYEAWCFCSNFYHFTAKLQDRFIVERDLSRFSWYKHLNKDAIKTMLSYKTYSTRLVSSLPKMNTTDQSASRLKKRTYGNKTTWHIQECHDWHCNEECLSNDYVE